MINFARWLFTITVGVIIGWTLGTIGFMSSVASLNREAERKASSVKNHPSRRNSNNPSVIPVGKREDKYDPNLSTIKRIPPGYGRRIVNSQQYDALYDKYKRKPE